MLTIDWNSTAFGRLVAMAERLETQASWLLAFLMHESGCRATACKSEFRVPIQVGLNQLRCQRSAPNVPSDLEQAGWTGKATDYLSLSPEEQLPFVERYLLAHKGKLMSPTACCLSNFLPADLLYASDPSFILIDSGDRFNGDTRTQTFPMRNRTSYWRNVALDRGGKSEKSALVHAGRKGYITVGDLDTAIQIACSPPRFAELSGRLKRIEHPTSPLSPSHHPALTLPYDGPPTIP